MGKYAKNAVAVFSLKYHLVWCSKYRRQVLVAPVDARLKEVLADVSKSHGWKLHTLEVMPDHVHVFVEADPTACAAEIVNRLKGASSRILRDEFPSLKSRLPTLWSRSYFAGTVGSVSEAVISRYIESQKGK